MQMKKRYLRPAVEAMEIENERMLCSSGVSGSMGDSANSPALAPYWDEDWEEE
jgi:hypothetical protein